MEIIKIYANHSAKQSHESIACIGYFDGLHLGHQKLFEKVKTIAKEKNLKSACICFDNDPWIVMNKSSDTSQLTPLSLRLKKLEAAGMDLCYLLHFDEKMMKLSVEEFIKNVLNLLNLKTLVCGEDFHFAYQGEGNNCDLKKQLFSLEIVNEVCHHGKKISSSNIETLIRKGKMEEANIQLGYEYALSGKVIHGNGVGKRLLGFPTANIALDEAFVLMKEGVYAGRVLYKNKEFLAMINVGHNPTMNHKQELSIEAHLIGFDEMIYDESICIAFTRRLRDEQKFKTTEDLIKQLNKDIKNVENYKG